MHYLQWCACMCIFPPLKNIFLKKTEKPRLRDFNQISRDEKLPTMSTAASAGAWKEGI